MVTDTVSFTYDDLGNLETATDSDSSLTFTPDPLGRVSSVVTGGTLGATTVSYTYDKSGNRATLTDPQGFVTTYAYDELNRLTTLTSHQGIFTFGYDDASRRTSLTFPNGVTLDYDFDDASQLLSLEYLNPAQQVLSKFDYTYDDAGNRDTRTTLDGVTSYGYEDLDRLTSAVGPDPANPMQTLIESYDYDAVGNRTASHLATGQMHDDANRLLEDSRFEFDYDANGNMTSKQDQVTLELTTYDWDVEDRLIAVHTPTQTVSFRYDPLGRRIEKAGATTTRYIHDQEDITDERDGTNALTFRYVHGPGIDEPLARRDVAAGQTVFFHVDGVGSIADTSNTAQPPQVSTAYRYDSYGNPLVGVNSSGFAFTGREWDTDIDLYHYRARYYDPDTGRFISADPIAFVGGINFYAYAGQNPLNYLDSFGLDLIPVDLPGLGRSYLDDAFAPLVQDFIENARRRGLIPTFNSAYRTPERQRALEKDPDAITPAVESLHSCGFAVDVNYSSLPNDSLRRRLREAAREAGLDWGGDFREPDPPHFYKDPGGNRAERIRRAAERYQQLTRPTPLPNP